MNVTATSLDPPVGGCLLGAFNPKNLLHVLCIFFHPKLLGQRTGLSSFHRKKQKKQAEFKHPEAAKGSPAAWTGTARSEGEATGAHDRSQPGAMAEAQSCGTADGADGADGAGAGGTEGVGGGWVGVVFPKSMVSLGQALKANRQDCWFHQILLSPMPGRQLCWLVFGMRGCQVTFQKVVFSWFWGNPLMYLH